MMNRTLPKPNQQVFLPAIKAPAKGQKLAILSGALLFVSVRRLLDLSIGSEMSPLGHTCEL